MSTSDTENRSTAGMEDAEQEVASQASGTSLSDSEPEAVALYSGKLRALKVQVKSDFTNARRTLIVDLRRVSSGELSFDQVASSPVLTECYERAASVIAELVSVYTTEDNNSQAEKMLRELEKLQEEYAEASAMIVEYGRGAVEDPVPRSRRLYAAPHDSSHDERSIQFQDSRYDARTRGASPYLPLQRRSLNSRQLSQSLSDLSIQGPRDAVNVAAAIHEEHHAPVQGWPQASDERRTPTGLSADGGDQTKEIQISSEHEQQSQREVPQVTQTAVAAPPPATSSCVVPQTSSVAGLVVAPTASSATSATKTQAPRQPRGAAEVTTRATASTSYSAQSSSASRPAAGRQHQASQGIAAHASQASKVRSTHSQPATRQHLTSASAVSMPRIYPTPGANPASASASYIYSSSSYGANSYSAMPSMQFSSPNQYGTQQPMWTGNNITQPSYATYSNVPQMVAQTPSMTTQHGLALPAAEATTMPQPQSALTAPHQPEPWRQLKQIGIPTFNGDKRKFESWRAAFMACIDASPAAPEYKLLQLRQYLVGDPLDSIDSLGYSPAAYEAAKALLVRKYGGERRRVAIHVEEIEQFGKVGYNRASEFEKFTELLEVVVINLKDSGRAAELEAGTFYQKLLRKFDERVLAQYHRWRYDRQVEESVEALLEWARVESELMMISAETVSGVAVKTTPQQQQPPRDNRFQRRSAPPSRNHAYHAQQKSDVNCAVCKGAHPLWKCAAFKVMSVNQRWRLAKQSNACFRCLGSGHAGKDCPRDRECPVSGCIKHHHPLLHGSNVTGSAQPTPEAEKPAPQTSLVTTVTEGEPEAATHVAQGRRTDRVALRTIPVTLCNGQQSVTVNALLDDASTVTYVHTSIATRLGLSGKRQRTTVSTLNGKLETFETMPVDIGLRSVDGNLKQTITAYTTDKSVTGDLRAVDWLEEASNYPHLREIPFPAVGEHDTVDMLIGSDQVQLHVSTRDVIGEPGQPVARLTPLGWTCVGKLRAPNSKQTQGPQPNRSYYVGGDKSIAGVEQALQQFWKVDSCGVETDNAAPGPTSADEAAAVKLVEDSTRLVDGRYEVSIPWNSRKAELVNNVDMATKRLESTRRRLQREPQVARAYARVIQDYLEKGYITDVTDEASTDQCWYLPHFAIVRPQKTTTKVRIVFDAAASYHGISLNDAIHAGPKLQRDLCDVLTRFRRKPIAVACDVAEMYLQVSIRPEDRPYHRFLWQDPASDGPVKKYQFNRLVFGVNASPFLAQYVARQVADASVDTHRSAAEAILDSTYMDDTMDSTATVADGTKLHDDLMELWGKASMRPRKWLSNSTALLSTIPEEERAADVDLTVGDLPSVKTLGVTWSALDDEFTFRVQQPDLPKRITKRYLLQRTAAVFDPLGFISPFVVRGKMLMQECWMSGVDWDEQLPDAIVDKAQQWFQELSELSNVRVPRQFEASTGKLELHAFCDASSEAYGVVLYARSVREDGTAECRFLVSKSRVAPTAATSIPRLELMAAVLGHQVATRMSKVLDVPLSTVTFWSDSTTVLHWIRSYSRRFKPFVANRVSYIQQRTAPRQWRYVPTGQNPADLASRGVCVNDLVNADLWWQGPAFLSNGSTWPATELKDTSGLSDDPEVRKAAVQASESAFVTQQITVVQPSRYSNWTRLVRVQAWINRFVNNCRQGDRVSGELNIQELEAAELAIIYGAQQDAFGDDISALKKGKTLPAASRLAKMCPRLDEDGLLRCDGRTRLADWLPYSTRFPIILPRKHEVTSLIVKHHHELRQHGGTNETLAALTERFWLESAREEIRQWEAECMVCRRRKARTAEQVMAPLPKVRLATPLRAFARASVDYGGPYLTKQGRGRSQAKRYLCVFTCLLTRAVHLEMSYGLDASSFLNAFSRMVARRGKPLEIISDNGTNFVAADRELRELVEALDNDAVFKSLANRGVAWKFNPPLAPHFGGVHEVMVKAAKRALKAVLGNADLTDEMLATALTNAESLMNSRPLTYQSASPDDSSPLTPNHFLTGQMGGQFAPESVDTTGFHPNQRWRQVQDVVKQFWRRWLKEWVPTLNARRKWLKERRDVAAGDIVLVLQPDAPRGHWPLGRVMETKPGPDGHVRVVEVQVGGKRITRPITKICPLDA